MSLKLDNLETFKKHRNKISESLTSELVGREKERNEICNLLSSKNFIAITGPAGIGKSRLAVAAIEKYISINDDIEVLCVKSFGDYISALDEAIVNSKKFLFFFDDANNFEKLNEIMEWLKYNQNGNIKAIFTVRDYLKNCLDEEIISFYRVEQLSDDDIKKAIEKNTSIHNIEWLKKIAEISKGNIRVAFIAASVATQEEKGLTSFFNIENIINSFYKDQIIKISNSTNLIITAGIISFFKSIYLNQLFYISLILKIAGISKQEFLSCVNDLIAMELVDECVGVVKMSDQCFSDYLLNYVFIEKKYIKLSDIIVSAYKFYKKRIIKSLNTILNTYFSNEVLLYTREEIIKACLQVQDVKLKLNIETAFAPIILDYVVIEFKKGVENYNDEGDIGWLLGIFKSLAKSEYNMVANEGIVRLLEKTNLKKDAIFKAIEEVYVLDYDSVKFSFKYHYSFVDHINNNKIQDDNLLSIVSSYLKYSFSNMRFVDEYKVEHSSFNIMDEMDKIVEFRKKCWEYIFSYSLKQSLNVIIKFANNYIIDGAVNIVKSDLIVINKYLADCENVELIYAILYVKMQNDAKKYGFSEALVQPTRYVEILKIILERKALNESRDAFMEKHKNKVSSFYVSNKDNVFKILEELEPISEYFINDIKGFLKILLDYLEEFSPLILNTFIKYEVSSNYVIEKSYTIIGIQKLYEEILTIKEEYIQDEYLYSFYSLINKLNIKETYCFEIWIKSKKDLKIKRTYDRKVLNLKRVAEKVGISYIKLIKTVFKKKKYNELIAKAYLSYLFYQEGTFNEILNLDLNLAIEIYEFLIKNKETDYNYVLLREIVSLKKNYIKKFAIWFVEEGIYETEGLEKFIFEEDIYKLFFDTCVKIGEKKLPDFKPYNIQKFISSCIDNQKMVDWIYDYIDKNKNKDKAMESLFSILAGINIEYRNRFILKYYEEGKNKNILKYAILNSIEFYSLNSSEKYLKTKIEELNFLKNSLIKWDSVEQIVFINEIIEKYYYRIKRNKISQLIEHVDSSLLKEIQEIDEKTEISLDDAFKLYIGDENFRKMLSSGYVSYKDGCFVTQSNTPLKFIDVLNDKKILTIKVVPADEDEEIKYDNYLYSMRKIVEKFSNTKQPTLDECLYSLFNERRWDVDIFGQETSLNKDLFSKIKNNKRNKLEKVTLIKILIGLKPLRKERNYLLELNGTQLSSTNEDDVLYEFILDAKLDIDTADLLLKELGKEGFLKNYSD